MTSTTVILSFPSISFCACLWDCSINRSIDRLLSILLFLLGLSVLCLTVARPGPYRYIEPMSGTLLFPSLSSSPPSLSQCAWSIRAPKKFFHPVFLLISFPVECFLVLIDVVIMLVRCNFGALECCLIVQNQHRNYINQPLRSHSLSPEFFVHTRPLLDKIP